MKRMDVEGKLGARWKRWALIRKGRMWRRRWKRLARGWETRLDLGVVLICIAKSFLKYEMY